MTLVQRLCVGAAALVFSACNAAAAAAESPKPLTEADARAYASAFQAADAGDFVGAQLEAAEIKDKSLLGYLSFRQLMHPTAHKASYDELTSWLDKFKDLPLAERIFSLASKRKPADAKDPPAPEVPDLAEDPAVTAARQSREAFYSGDPTKAFYLAVAAGERWIAGLAAYRLRNYPEAQVHFAELARDGAEDPWLRAAAAFWASRAAQAVGDERTSGEFLALAASQPETFYGMIAERRIQLSGARAETGGLTLASYRSAPPPAPAPAAPAAAPSKSLRELARFASKERRAHRAAALAQIGRLEEARYELRAGLAQARTEEEKELWGALMAAVAPAPRKVATAPVPATRPQPGYQILGSRYPAPPLEPKWGFTIDKALVYAIVYQESRFNPQAVSPVGAVGLMQLMPETAALTAGDDKLKKDTTPLLDPAFNLRVGQDYLKYLMDRGVGPDVLKMVAAYNGGPGSVLKAQNVAGEDDSLLVIECLPAQETRNYVEKVMAAYWTYKRMFGEDARSLDALASGARSVDLRLDLADPNRGQPQLAPQTMQVGAS